jgi:hypothetical protein
MLKAEGERGYPLFFFNGSPVRIISTLVALLIIALSVAGYVWYNRMGFDPTPDSTAGYIFAYIGTGFFILAVVSYSIYRRSRRRGVGTLNGALQWHIAFAVIAIFILFLHSFGNFNPRTGTYALYSMIALVISGFIGRGFDHFMSRAIAQEASKALTEQGEDRIESITQQLQSTVVYNTQEELRGFAAAPGGVQAASGGKQNAALAEPALLNGSGSPATLQTSWDLAYISLEETPQELSRDPQYRFVPDRKSTLSRPGALIPGAQEHIVSLQIVEQALAREQFYRYIIRYWRVFHVLLALVTVGLTLWHLEYALSLLIPVWLHQLHLLHN